MDKTHAQKLKDFEKEIFGLKKKIYALEEKLKQYSAELQAQEDEEVDFTGLDITAEPAGGEDNFTGSLFD